MTLFSGLGHKYRALIHYLIRHDQRIVRSLADVTTPSECEFLAKSLLKICLKTGCTFCFLESIINYEFEKYKDTPSNIFRLNSLASKFLGHYIRRIACDYLNTVLSGILTEMLNGESLEIDPSKIHGDDEQVAAKVKENQQKLAKWCQDIFDRMTEPAVRILMPPEIRLIASFIADSSERYGLPTNILVGGYMLLRFFNPVIAAPETWGIVSPELVRDGGRRNLILVTKVLQNLANSVEFGRKEEYMICMNSFVNGNAEAIKEYLNYVTDKSTMQMCFTTRTYSPPKQQDLDLNTFDLRDLMGIHKLLNDYQFKMVPFIENDPMKQEGDTSDEEIFRFFDELGPSPFSSASQQLEPKDRRESMGASAFPSHLRPPQTKEQIGSAARVEQHIFYQGPPDRQGLPLFYFIAGRLKTGQVPSADKMAEHMEQVIGTHGNKPFTMVVDLSWTNVADHNRSDIQQMIAEVSELLPEAYKKNVGKIHLVHPGSSGKSVMSLLRAGQLANPRFIELYNWKELDQYVDLATVMLPEESRLYFAKMYEVVKVNAKGKHQHRAIKITPHSILNVEPKLQTIQNERLLKEIEEIESPPDTLEVNIRLGPPAKPYDPALGIFDAQKKDEQDASIRRYICRDKEERRSLLEDLFETAVRSQSIPFPHAFEVTKSNKKGKVEKRTFRLTNDSILNLDARSIRKEFAFASIDYFVLDTGRENTALMKLKSETEARIITCAHAAELVQTVKEAVDRFLAQKIMQEQSEEDSVAEATVTEVLTRTNRHYSLWPGAPEGCSTLTSPARRRNTKPAPLPPQLSTVRLGPQGLGNTTQMTAQLSVETVLTVSKSCEGSQEQC